MIGVVAIGRNEGERLRRCLESALKVSNALVYVDSGSQDASVELAKTLGAEVVQLDLTTPFTAARSRNAGIARLRERHPAIAFVQVVDGDCEIVDGWIQRAIQEMNDHRLVAVVCGRRRERYPEQSVYNRLCDMEWDTPVGEADACGGDALFRLDAMKQVGGYDETIIAGEEPELCLRLRLAGWKVHRVDHEMTLHDAAMTRFGQWWKRNVRSGHAYAEGHAMHGRAHGYCAREVRSIIEWGLILPVLMFGLMWPTWSLSLLLFAAYVWLWLRVRNGRLAHGNTRKDAGDYATYCVLGKFAQLVGIIKYWFNRLLGRRTQLIEYKGPASPVAAAEVGASQS